MPYLIGVLLALATVVLAWSIGLDRRSFYATVVIVVATYYVLFAVIGGSSRVLMIESSVTVLFVLLAAIGFRTHMWVIAAGLALHGAFDFVHGAVVTNTGMPLWWPAFCAAYDVAAGVALALMIWKQPRPAGVGMSS